MGQIRLIRNFLVFFLFGCVWLTPSYANSSLDNMQEVSQNILDKLFAVTNNKRVSFSSPKVVVSTEKKFVAAFFPLKNEIVLEAAAFDVCREFGADSLSALAFILGHELAHSFQMEIIKNTQQTSYMAYHNHYDDAFKLEKGADIAGAFNAYLAGYKTSGIINELIDRLYTEYSLSEHISGYPAKSERLNTADEVSAILSNLIDVFEVASYLIAAGEFKLAAACYEKILTYYQGAEIYNNLGVCYAMHAMAFTESDFDLYLYPFVLDQNFRINKPKKSRGDDDLNEEDKKLRELYLGKALKSLKEAISLDQTYFDADINILCVYSLLQENSKTIDHYQKRGMKFRGEMNNSELFDMRAKVALSIAYAITDDERAKPLFESLSNSRYPYISYISKYNERIYMEGHCGAAEEYSCIQVFDHDSAVDGVYLHRPILKGKDVILTEEGRLVVHIEQLENSIVYRFVEDEELTFTLQRIKTNKVVNLKNEISEDKKFHSVNTSNGVNIVCSQERRVFSINSSLTKVREWVKYSDN